MKKEVLFKDIKLAYVNLSRAIKNATETSLKYEIMISEKEYSEGKSKQIKDVDNYLNTLINARN